MVDKDTVSSCLPGLGADHSAKTHHPNPPFCHTEENRDPQCPVGGILPGDDGTVSGKCLESLKEAAPRWRAVALLPLLSTQPAVRLLP